VLPLLKDKPSSFALADNCRNAGAFPSVAAFNNEYTTCYTDRDLANLLGGVTTSTANIENILIRPIEPFEHPMRHYYAYRRSQFRHSKLHELNERADVEHWLHTMLFKIALPVCRDEFMAQVYSPLTFATFFRLLVRLYELGYPAHWLSDVVSSILNNQLHTTARFPRTSPLTIAESKQKNTRIHVDIAPFLLELSNLAAMWLAELPFGIANPLRIPCLSNIKQYKVRFTEITGLEKEDRQSARALTLLFARLDAREAAMNQATRVPDFTFRKALMSDDQGYHDAAFVTVRQKSFVIATWTWDRDTRTASFWFDSVLMKQMLPERPMWNVNILRTDVWADAAVTDRLDSVVSEEES
jgi:hypothetical protein